MEFGVAHFQTGQLGFPGRPGTLDPSPILEYHSGSDDLFVAVLPPPGSPSLCGHRRPSIGLRETYSILEP